MLRVSQACKQATATPSPFISALIKARRHARISLLTHLIFTPISITPLGLALTLVEQSDEAIAVPVVAVALRRTLWCRGLWAAICRSMHWGWQIHQRVKAPAGPWVLRWTGADRPRTIWRTPRCRNAHCSS